MFSSRSVSSSLRMFMAESDFSFSIGGGIMNFVEGSYYGIGKAIEGKGKAILMIRSKKCVI